LDDANLREAMGKRATEYAQSYTWDKIAAQIVDVYQALLNKNKENGIR
jgi:glycosyltransferase involved in cell wall biosynthesis